MTTRVIVIIVIINQWHFGCVGFDFVASEADAQHTDNNSTTMRRGGGNNSGPSSSSSIVNNKISVTDIPSWDFRSEEISLKLEQEAQDRHILITSSSFCVMLRHRRKARRLGILNRRC